MPGLVLEVALFVMDLLNLSTHLSLILKASSLKWSGKFGQHAKMYPTRMNGYT